MSNKVIVISLLLVIFAQSGFAESYVSGGFVGEDGKKSQSLTYEFKPNEIDTFKVGFSTAPVSSLSTNVAGEPDGEMKIQDDFTAVLSDDVYVFWQIASHNQTSITVSATRMTAEGVDDFLDVTLTTERGSQSNDGDGRVIEKPLTTGNENIEVSQEILSYKADSPYRCAGSQKVNLKAEALYGIADASYSGTLKATIKTNG